MSNILDEMHVSPRDHERSTRTDRVGAVVNVDTNSALDDVEHLGGITILAFTRMMIQGTYEGIVLSALCRFRLFRCDLHLTSSNKGLIGKHLLEFELSALCRFRVEMLL